MGLEYKQTTQGQNLSTLAVPTAPKAKSSSVAASRVQMPKSWTSTLLPTLIKAGVQGVGMYVEGVENEAKQHLATTVNGMASKQTQIDTLHLNAMEAKDEDAIKVYKSDDWSSGNTGKAKLKRIQQAWESEVNYIDSLDLSVSKKTKLWNETNTLFNNKVISGQKLVAKEFKENKTNEVMKKFNQESYASISNGVFNTDDIEDAEKSLSSLGYTTKEANDLLYGTVSQHIDSIKDNKFLLEELHSELTDWAAEGNLKAISVINKTDDRIKALEKSSAIDTKKKTKVKAEDIAKGIEDDIDNNYLSTDKDGNIIIDDSKYSDLKRALELKGLEPAAIDRRVSKAIKADTNLINKRSEVQNTKLKIAIEKEKVKRQNLIQKQKARAELVTYNTKVLKEKEAQEAKVIRVGEAVAKKARDTRIKEAFTTGNVVPTIRDNKNIVFEHITVESLADDRATLISGLQNSQLTRDLIAQGASPEMVQTQLAKYIDEVYLPKEVSEAYKKVKGQHLPLDLIPPQFKKYLKQDIISETMDDVAQGLQGVTERFININTNFKVNPKIVSSTVGNYFKDAYHDLMYQSKQDKPDLNRLAQSKQRLGTLIGSLDKKLIDSAIDKDLYLKLEILQKFDPAEARLAIGKINDGVQVAKSLVGLRLDKTQRVWFNNLPDNDRPNVIKDYAQNVLVYEQVDFSKFKEGYEHRKHNGVTLDKAIAGEFNTEPDRDALLYFMKGNHTSDGTYYEYQIPEGATIKKVGDSYGVWYGGTLLTAKSSKEVLEFKKEDGVRREQEELFNKDKGGAWYSWLFKSYKGLGLGGERDATINPYTRDEFYKNSRR